MHRVHVPAARPPSVLVTGSEAHHITHVLRLSTGDEVAVFDGDGREWSGRIRSSSRSNVAIDLGEPRTAVAEPPAHVTVAVAILKGTQLDDVVRDATMLGAAAIVPFVSAHVAVAERAWKSWKSGAADRWSRVASASASQCGRAVVPRIEPVSSFDTLVTGGAFDSIVMCVEPAGGRQHPVSSLARAPRVLLMVGPEGGWAAEELDLARRHGASFISLGPRTLRAEAAATVALTALWTEWGWEKG
jgi:16S rRNA (uracil1498-N3)-methyltransferase